MDDKTTKIISIKIDSEKAVKTMNDLNDIIADVKRQETELSKEIKENEKTQKLSTEQIEEKKQQLIALKEAEKDYRAQVGEVSRVVQKELQADRAKSGSLKQLRAELSNLTKQYDELSREERTNEEVGGAILSRINELTTEIKDAEYESQRFQRNVGNYPDAMKPVTAEIRELTQQLIRLKMEGKENTEEYKSLLTQVGNMKDKMADAQREVKQMASDTGTLNSVLDGAKLAAGAFSAALGVMNIVGGEDTETQKKLAEAQKKLQAAIAVTTGLQAVQNALQKESALMMGIHKLQIWAAAKAQDAYTAATGRATIAQRIFNGVANANPYVLLATALITVVGAIAAFTRGSKEQEEQTEKTNIELEKQVTILKNLQDVYDRSFNQRKKDGERELELMKARGESIEAIREKEDAMNRDLDANIRARETMYSNELSTMGVYEAKLNEATQEYEAIQVEIGNIMMNRAELDDETTREALENAKQRQDAAKKEMESMAGMLDFLQKIKDDRKDYNAMIEKQTLERAAEDKAIKDKQEQEAKARREKQKQEQEKYHELTIQEMQKAEDALNALIADEFEQRRAIENTSYERKMQDLDKAMAEEAKKHGTNSELYKAYLTQRETMRRQHEQTMGDIATDEANKEKEIYENGRKMMEEQDELYWQNRINEIIAAGQDASNTELEMLKHKMETMTQYADESDAEFYSRRLAAQIAYNNKKKELNQAEMAMDKAKAEYAANIAGAISSTLEAVAGDNVNMVKAAKIAALAEVAIKQGAAIAEAVAAATPGDPYTVALRVGSAVASTIAAMASAIASINSAKFARGTSYVTGPGTATSDSIPAMLSVGEGVVNARANSLFPGLVQAINDIGNGINVPMQNQTTYNYNSVANATGGITPEQIAEAMSKMPQPQVAVSEIKRVNTRVEVIENLRTN